MGVYTIKNGSIWQGGKQLHAGDVVELSDKDRQLIDPQHTDLQSSEEAQAEAEQLAAEAEKKAAAAKAIAELEAKKAAEKAEKSPTSKKEKHS